MIRRINSLTNLAIVGMSVVLPGGGDIDEFGRLVYRGLPIAGHFGDREALESAAAKSIRQVCKGARLEVEQVHIISLSPSINGILAGNLTGSQVEEVSGILPAMNAVSDWLESSDEDAVLLIEHQEDAAMICALLVATQKSAQDNARPVYALVVGAADAGGPLNVAAISAVLYEARQVSGIEPKMIGLIVTATLKAGTISSEEAEGLLKAEESSQPLTCALGSTLPGVAGIVKTVWCLSRRVIPCSPGWSGPVQTEAWKRSPFYVETDSRAWFIPVSQNKRIAGLNLLAPDGSFTHILFSDTPPFAAQYIEAPRREALHLFPIATNSLGELPGRLSTLQSKLVSGSDLAEAAQDAYKQYLLETADAKNVVCLLGSTPEELLREIGFATKGIPGAFEKQSDWKTPQGSFFTPQPLGKEGKVSFVYPGAFNSYPGIGRDLFYLFPNLYDQFSGISKDIGGLLNELQLYPRSMSVLTADDLNAIEAHLSTDPITMLISGSSLAFLYTEVLQKVFQIHPASAFGYSLGEVSMLFASRVWTEADQTSKALRESPLFRTRLSGPQNAVREYWKIPTRGEDDPPETIWGNYLLMTGAEEVKEALVGETRVYLTHVNTPRQVVIGGDPDRCRRVISKLKCKSLQAPFNYAIHCEPIHSEYEKLIELHSVPVSNQPNMTLYSAATYQPMPIDRQKIAKQIAQELCHCLDFPRLIQLAYNDGARIFIELGAGSNCARWVNETLEGQAHAAFSINRKGVDDHTSILRLMARMVSHRVPVNLNLLYQG
ncbi:MAG: PfaB family protein [Anaerolineales bacterium]